MSDSVEQLLPAANSGRNNVPLPNAGLSSSRPNHFWSYLPAIPSRTPCSSKQYHHTLAPQNSDTHGRNSHPQRTQSPYNPSNGVRNVNTSQTVVTTLQTPTIPARPTPSATNYKLHLFLILQRLYIFRMLNLYSSPHGRFDV